MTHTLKTLLALPADELRQLVASFDGWEKIPHKFYHDKIAFTRKIKGGIRIVASCDLPDYPNSLDAMPPLEDGLTDEEYCRFLMMLGEAQGMKQGELNETTGWRKLTSATAHHRAVAFVATKMKL